MAHPAMERTGITGRVRLVTVVHHEPVGTLSGYVMAGWGHGAPVVCVLPHVVEARDLDQVRRSGEQHDRQKQTGHDAPHRSALPPAGEQRPRGTRGVQRGRS